MDQLEDNINNELFDEVMNNLLLGLNSKDSPVIIYNNLTSLFDDYRGFIINKVNDEFEMQMSYKITIYEIIIGIIFVKFLPKTKLQTIKVYDNKYELSFVVSPYNHVIFLEHTSLSEINKQVIYDSLNIIADINEEIDINEKIDEEIDIDEVDIDEILRCEEELITAHIEESNHVDDMLPDLEQYDHILRSYTDNKGYIKEIIYQNEEYSYESLNDFIIKILDNIELKDNKEVISDFINRYNFNRRIKRARV